MNFFRTALAAAAIAAVSLTSGTAFADKLQDILNAGKVRIGVLADSAPWGFRDGEGKLTGFDVELANIVAADLGVDLEIVEVTGAARLPSLLSDQIDVLVAAAGATPERAQQVMFTSPYVAVQLGVYGKAGTPTYSTPAELSGKSIAVARGTTLDVWLTDNVPDANLVRFEDAASALAAFFAGHTGINHISFTGSPQTGTAVAKAAAENHVPVTLELGGKSPQVLFADANLDEALPVVVNAIVQNAGQTCAAGSRVLIERSIYPEVMKRLAERFAALKVGPGIDDPDCGPIVSARQLRRVTELVEAALADGARVVAQAQKNADAPDGGYYFPPMLLDGAAPDSRLACDEIFGPVLAAFPFDDEAEAIRLANGTPYGLTASVWTQDGGRQMRCAHAIEAGQVFINNYGAGGGIELPFGGMKRSGYGREKAFEGMVSFTTIKTVVLKHG